MTDLPVGQARVMLRYHSEEVSMALNLLLGEMQHARKDYPQEVLDELPALEAASAAAYRLWRLSAPKPKETE